MTPQQMFRRNQVCLVHISVDYDMWQLQGHRFILVIDPYLHRLVDWHVWPNAKMQVPALVALKRAIGIPIPTHLIRAGLFAALSNGELQAHANDIIREYNGHRQIEGGVGVEGVWRSPLTVSQAGRAIALALRDAPSDGIQRVG